MSRPARFPFEEDAMRMRSGLAPFAAAVAVALLGLTTQANDAVAGPEWTRLRSPNFTLEGNVPERDLRAVARRFEQFREVLNRLLPNASLVTPTPLSVVVFAYNRDFKPVLPLFNGKPIEAAGYALTSPVGTSITLCLEYDERAYPVIYHEYGHLLISNAVPHLPVWASEGLAEYYKTFELSADGRKALVGSPPTASELSQLQGRNLIPMSDLLSAGHDSELYNVSKNRGRFYLQSWALVHYLLLGSPARKGQFDQFINRVAAGAPPAEAFKATVTGADTLDAELTQYVSNLTFGAVQYTFKEKVAGDRAYTVEKMIPADAECALGHLLLQQRRYTESGARFAAALKADPKASSAHTGMGLIELNQGRALEALPALRKGVEFGGDSVLAHYSLGLAALRCRSAECAAQQAGNEAARRAFQRAVELLPDFPDALSYLGYTEMATGGSLADAEKHLTAAIRLIPGREDYRFNLAQVYMRGQQFEQAQALLGPIAASPDATQSAQAREVLGRLATMKNAAATARAVSSLQAAPPSPASSDPPGAAGAASTGAPNYVPLYRKTLEGERRIEGTLVSIECPRSGIVLVLRDTAASHRFAVPSFDKVEFIPYRDDLKGSITCGPQAEGLRVYVTFRPPAAGGAPPVSGVEGVVIAVEFLPKAK
jgi:tetratricopeptide (TPR) repeat protein